MGCPIADTSCTESGQAAAYLANNHCFLPATTRYGQKLLRTAFRVYTRNKVFTASNVLGLSVGISAALIIFLIVQFEYSYDKAEKDADRIFRVVMNFKFNGNDGYSAAVPAPLDTIKEFLVNETYARHLGFKSPEDAVGKQLDFNKMKVPIVGVMHDFHTQSLHGKIGPVVFAGFSERSYQFHVLLRPQRTGRVSW